MLHNMRQINKIFFQIKRLDEMLLLHRNTYIYESHVAQIEPDIKNKVT